MFVYLDRIKLKSLLKRNKGKSYTYGLCKESGELYYVGLGIKDRILKHHIDSDIKNNKNRAKINTYLKYGCKFVIFQFNTRDKCAKLEQDIISKFGRLDIGTGVLTNLTDGGEGPFGFKPSDKTRRLKSDIAKAKSHIFSEITKKQWANRSQEDIDKIVKEKSEMMTVMWNDPDLRQKFLTIQREMWNDPVLRAKRIDAIKASQRLPEVRDAHRERMKLKWKDPEYLELRKKNRALKMQRKQENLDSIKQDILQNETT